MIKIRCHVLWWSGKNAGPCHEDEAGECLCVFRNRERARKYMRDVLDVFDQEDQEGYEIRRATIEVSEPGRKP